MTETTEAQSASAEKLLLIEHLQQKIKKRRFYEKSDFYLHQSFTWISVLSSFTTAILAAFITNDRSNSDAIKYTIAVLAALTATLTLINKSFSFDKRALWNTIFRSRLEAIHRDLVLKNVAVDISVDQLNKLDLEMELNFPEIKK